MGREVRRVPAGFGHPVGEGWPGYLRDCGSLDCEGCTECERVHPPEGDGWQPWETTTEGSPMSPVFADGEALAQWMSVNPCGFAGTAISLDTARSWVFGPGWLPSMVVLGGQAMDGITAMAKMETL